jgi:hypothetical protein
MKGQEMRITVAGEGVCSTLFIVGFAQKRRLACAETVTAQKGAKNPSESPGNVKTLLCNMSVL